jgi:hypothetical protein
VDELYVLARRVLLDALDAIGVHREAVVLIGAQGIYVRVGDGDVQAVAPFTTDGDLAVDPSRLQELPPLEKELLAKDFAPAGVGTWKTIRKTAENPSVEVKVDFLVPDAVSPGTGRRSVVLPRHDRGSMRRTHGIEAALVDNDMMVLRAFDDDTRTHDIRVAGPAALLIAKLHKINDRQGADRLRSKDKDALDVLRLLQGTKTEDIAARYTKAVVDKRSSAVATDAVELLRTFFGERTAVGVGMLARATATLVDEDQVRTSCTLLANDLLDALRSG